MPCQTNAPGEEECESQDLGDAEEQAAAGPLDMRDSIPRRRKLSSKVRQGSWSLSQFVKTPPGKGKRLVRDSKESRTFLRSRLFPWESALLTKWRKATWLIFQFWVDPAAIAAPGAACKELAPKSWGLRRNCSVTSWNCICLNLLFCYEWSGLLNIMLWISCSLNSSYLCQSLILDCWSWPRYSLHSPCISLMLLIGLSSLSIPHTILILAASSSSAYVCDTHWQL